MNIKITVGIAVLLAVSLGGVAAEVDKANYGKFSTEFVTPHTPWAKPYIQGPLKVLSILPTFRHRESVELWQRLECEIIPVMTYSMSKFAEKMPVGYSETFDVDQDVVIEAARKALAQDWNVTLVGKSRWDSFPDFLRADILRKVKEQGAGLVLVLFNENDAVKYPPEIKDILALAPGPDGAWIANAIPWKDLAVLADTKPEEGVRTFAYGKGRVVALWYDETDFAKETAETFGATTKLVLVPHERSYWSKVKSPKVYEAQSPFYDYYMSLVTKAVLWASGKDSAVRITRLIPPVEAVDRESLSETDFKLTYQSRLQKPGKLILALAVRDETNKKEYAEEIEIPVKRGENTAVFRLTRRKEGKHFVDATIRAGGKVLDWSSCTFTVKAPYRIAEIKLDNFGIERGQPVKGAVTVEGVLPAGATVYLDVYDAFDGLMAKVPLTGEGASYPFSFNISDPRSILHTIHAKVKDKNGVVSEKLAEFTMPDRSVNDLTFTMWGGVSLEPTFKYQLQQLRKLGVNTVLDGPHFPPEAHAAAELGMKIMPYTFTAISWFKLIPGKRFREQCLVSSDDAGQWHTEPIKKNRDYVKKFDPYAPMGYWLGEESYLGLPGENLCYCDKCLAIFRDYLKATYGTVAALNQSWGTQLKNFSEAMPLTLDEAVAANQLPRWADFRRNMELRFTKITTDIADAMIEANPRSIPGSMSTCIINSDTGFDYWLLMSHLREFGPQPFGSSEPIEARYVSSFLQRPYRLNACYGYNSPEEKQSLTPWFSLALGCNGLFYYHVGNEEGQGGFATLTPTLEKPSYMFWLTMKEVEEIQTGIDKLLFTSAKNDDAVRVLYSQMSLHASTVRDPKNNWWPGLKAMESFYFALEDAGIQHGTISYQEVLDGKLKYPQIKALMLPETKSLSAGEAKAIRAFCESGGLVVADMMPGIMDEHLKTLPQSPLAKMFPKTDALTVTPGGKGKAVYLGDLLQGYGAKHHAGTGLDAVEKLAGILEKGARVKPVINVLTANGKPQVEVRPVLFQAGKNDYVLLVRERKNVPPVIVKVKFPAAGFIYDVRAGKLLDQGNSATISMGERRVDLIAQLPYKVEKIELSGKWLAGRQFTVSTAVRTAGGKAGHHILYLALKDAQGNILPYYPRKVTTQKGIYTGTFTLASNDPAGKYTLMAKDVASGVTGQIPLEVK